MTIQSASKAISSEFKTVSLWKVHNRRLMSTALIYCGLPDEGFVIGADGRAFNKLETRIESDTERKVLTFENKDTSIVFAWAGIVKARTLDFDFSLVSTTNDLLPTLHFDGYFAQELKDKLNDKLQILKTKDSGECAVGIFLSYRDGYPWISELSVFKNGRHWECLVKEGTPNGRITIVSGPDTTFDKPFSLDEAGFQIKAYLQDCVNHPTDEIGGHIHIARFTQSGVNWICPPK